MYLVVASRAVMLLLVASSAVMLLAVASSGGVTRWQGRLHVDLQGLLLGTTAMPVTRNAWVC